MRKAVIGVAVVAVSLVAVFAASATTTATTKLEATLNGKSEGAPKTNTGKVEVRLNAATGKVCWDFTLAKIDGKPNQAHIHKGKAGVAGNVVVPLGATYKRQGCTSAAKSLVKAILKSPGSYYVNVHNAKHPAGAMRGQLARGA
ncbi:MAG TPA: CHRD domain-containing protein [Gaiellaceae bacterium]|nr:CHRD domain-containing protein [Gaiellaceae bacterium]